MNLALTCEAIHWCVCVRLTICCLPAWELRLKPFQICQAKHFERPVPTSDAYIGWDDVIKNFRFYKSTKKHWPTISSSDNTNEMFITQILSIPDAIHRSKSKRQFTQADEAQHRHGLHRKFKRGPMLPLPPSSKLWRFRMGLDHSTQTVRRKLLQRRVPL